MTLAWQDPDADARPRTRAPEEVLVDQLIARAFRGGGWVLLSVVLTLGVGLLRTLFVANLIGPRELGVMAAAMLVLGAIESLTSTGVDTALVSQPGDVRPDLDAAFVIRATRGAALAAATWGLAPAVSAFFGDPAVLPVLRALSVVALLRGLANPAIALLVKRIEFRRLFWWGLPEVLSGAALAIGVAIVRGDVWALVAAAIGSQAVAVVTSYWMMPWRPRVPVPRGSVRKLLDYGKWVSGARTLMFLSLNADNAFVGRVLGTAALGGYQLAFRLAELPIVTVTRAAAQVALPALSQLRETPASLARGYRAIFRVVLAFNGAFAIAVLLFAEPVIDAVLGGEWLAIAPVMRILAVAMVCRGLIMAANQLFDAVRRPHLMVWLNAVRLALLLVLIVPLARVLGLEGVAVAMLLSSAGGAVMAAWMVESLIRRPDVA